MQAENLLKQGDLDACRAQLFSEVRQEPANPQLRVFLFQLACIQEDWARALSQLDVLRKMSDANLPLSNTYSQIIACEMKRQQVLSGEKDPLCLGAPLDWMAHFFQALKLYADGHIAQAREQSMMGANSATPIAGQIDGQAFSWLSDGDMRFGPILEVMLNGEYYVIPFEYIRRIDFELVEDLRDVVWRPAHLTLRNNGKFIVFVPVRYPTAADTSTQALLSKTCEWSMPAEDFYIGQGQRTFASEQDQFPLLRIQSIEFE